MTIILVHYVEDGTQHCNLKSMILSPEVVRLSCICRVLFPSVRSWLEQILWITTDEGHQYYKTLKLFIIIF